MNKKISFPILVVLILASFFYPVPETAKGEKISTDSSANSPEIVSIDLTSAGSPIPGETLVRVKGNQLCRVCDGSDDPVVESAEKSPSGQPVFVLQVSALHDTEVSGDGLNHILWLDTKITDPSGSPITKLSGSKKFILTTSSGGTAEFWLDLNSLTNRFNDGKVVAFGRVDRLGRILYDGTGNFRLRMLDIGSYKITVTDSIACTKKPYKNNEVEIVTKAIINVTANFVRSVTGVPEKLIGAFEECPQETHFYVDTGDYSDDFSFLIIGDKAS